MSQLLIISLVNEWENHSNLPSKYFKFKYCKILLKIQKNSKGILISIYFDSHEYCKVSHTTLRYHPKTEVLHRWNNRRSYRRTDTNLYPQHSVKAWNNIYINSGCFSIYSVIAIWYLEWNLSVFSIAKVNFNNGCN